MKRLTHLKHYFQGLKWYQSWEFALLALLTLSLTIDWHWGVWTLMLWSAFTIVKCVASRQLGNPALPSFARISLGLVILLYLLYALSTLYSCNPQEAWSTTLITMLTMVLLPAIFLASDMRYLTSQHRVVLIHLFALGLSIRFLIMALRAVVRYTQGTPLDLLLDFHFDPFHHNYLAMYLITAVALLYTELSRHWQSPLWRKRRWWVIADMGLLIIYMVVMGSRSGLVILALLVVACICHLMIVRKQWLATGLMILGLAVLVGASYLAVPKMYWRIIYLVEQMAAGNRGDGRQVMWQCGYELVQERPLLGHGCDGYWTKLHDSYVEHDFAEGFLHEQYNTHNQYLETTLATGLLGLCVMLAFILLPALASCRKRHRNLPFLLFTLVYAGCIAFEASFARQMGLLFIFFWYPLLLLPLSRPS